MVVIRMTYAQLKGHLRTSIGRFVSKTFDGIPKGFLNERYFTILVVPGWIYAKVSPRNKIRQTRQTDSPNKGARNGKPCPVVCSTSKSSLQ